MLLPKAMTDDLRRLLRRFAAANGPATVPGGAGKALEVWLALRLARRAQLSGSWRVTLRQGDGSRLPPGSAFVVSAGQVDIRPGAPADPGWILLTHVGKTPQPDGPEDLSPAGATYVDGYELHVGLQWLGRSDATHECDVSLIPQAISRPLRVAGGGHPRGLPAAAFECKARSGSANTDEMRQSVARMFDLALVTKPHRNFGCRMFEAKTMTRWGRTWSTYRAFFEAGVFDVVRTGSFSQGAHDLGRHYHVGMFGNVHMDPRSIARVGVRFMDLLDRLPAI
jgi:hypothetical protein